MWRRDIGYTAIVTVYLKPTPTQRRLLAAYISEGTVAKAAAKLGMGVDAAERQMAYARRRTGMHTLGMIAAGLRDGWLVEERMAR